MPNGFPRAQTFSNILALIFPKRFNACLRAHLGALSPLIHEQIRALGGKSLRGSHALKQGPVHVVHAWATEQRLTICQDHVAEKKNEIAAMGCILDLLDLEGHTVTIDAMGTQRKFARKSTSKKGDYLFTLKGNQGRLHKEAVDHFHFALRHLKLMTAKGWSLHQDHKKGHDRNALCSIVATHRQYWMNSEIGDQWADLRTLIVVKSDAVECSTCRQRRSGKRYYLSSLPADSRRLRESIRVHWRIENNCHWILDMCFKEDANQTGSGNAAKNLGTVRRIVLNILNHDTGTVKTL